MRPISSVYLCCTVNAVGVRPTAIQAPQVGTVVLKEPRSTCRYSALTDQLSASAYSKPAPAVQPVRVVVLLTDEKTPPTTGAQPKKHIVSVLFTVPNAT